MSSGAGKWGSVTEYAKKWQQRWDLFRILTKEEENIIMQIYDFTHSGYRNEYWLF